MLFRDWIKGQTKANGRVGELAKTISGISLPDSDRKAMRKFLKERGYEDEVLRAFDVSFRAYREMT